MWALLCILICMISTFGKIVMVILTPDPTHMIHLQRTHLRWWRACGWAWQWPVRGALQRAAYWWDNNLFYSISQCHRWHIMRRVTYIVVPQRSRGIKPSIFQCLLSQMTQSGSCNILCRLLQTDVTLSTHKAKTNIFFPVTHRGDLSPVLNNEYVWVDIFVDEPLYSFHLVKGRTFIRRGKS